MVESWVRVGRRFTDVGKRGRVDESVISYTGVDRESEVVLCLVRLGSF